MNIQYKAGDLFTAIDNDNDPGAIVIAHCCNDQGKFGAGFVVPLAKRFPIVKERYLTWRQQENFRLGNTQFVNIDDKIFCANMIAQTLGGSRPLYYNHLARCMDQVGDFIIERNCAREHQTRLICPAFGSKLAGGNWSIIEQLIQDCWLRRGFPVTIYYLPGTLPEIEN